MILKQGIDVGIGQNVEYWKVTALHVYFEDSIQLELQGYISKAACDAEKQLPGARRQIQIDHNEVVMGTDFETQINVLLQASDEWKDAVEV